MLVALGKRSSTFSTSSVALSIVHIETNAPALPCARAVPAGVATPAVTVTGISWFINSVAVFECAQSIRDANHAVRGDAVGLVIHAVADGHDRREGNAGRGCFQVGAGAARRARDPAKHLAPFECFEARLKEILTAY